MNKLLFTTGVALALLLNSFFIVDEKEQAIVFQFGESIKNVTDPGLHMKIPFLQNVKYFDKRILDFHLNAEEIQAQDKKRVIVSAFVKYRIVDVLKFYQSIGTQEEARSRLYSILDSSLRQVIGKSPMIHLLSGERLEIMARIEKVINKKAERFGIDIKDVRILRADLPDENSKAIYRRMQSDREMEAKEYRAQGAEEADRITSVADKESKIIMADAYRKSQVLKGQGDSESIKIYANAYKKDSQFYDFYKSLDVYKKSFNKNNTKMVLSPDSDFMKFFDGYN